jgi:hypothetical protein
LEINVTRARSEKLQVAVAATDSDRPQWYVSSSILLAFGTLSLETGCPRSFNLYKSWKACAHPAHRVVHNDGLIPASFAAVISRQFREMTRARIESLLASFPKLIPTNTQHTSVETADVRYVYQPLEDLYIVLITNKASNILQDIETLHLFARVVSDVSKSAEEREILKHAFELLGAFDEMVNLGYREQMNLMQVRNVLEMESHEEKIQEIIARVCLLPMPMSFRMLTRLAE